MVVVFIIVLVCRGEVVFVEFVGFVLIGLVVA
jgi:hypothetical protein